MFILLLLLIGMKIKRNNVHVKDTQHDNLVFNSVVDGRDDDDDDI